MSMKCGLIGHKLGHSFSPRIHRELADYSYELFELEREELGSFFEKRDFAGVNVTIPYKKDAMSYCTELTDIARKIGCVNTIVHRADGTLLGHNTDYDGFKWLLESTGVSAGGKKALVLGSGGASLTAQTVLCDMGAESVIVVSRRGENNYSNIDIHSDAAILVNATPVGMYPHNGESPVDLNKLPGLECVIDVVYNPAKTKLLLDAERLNIRCANGLGMLVAQAAAASRMFLGLDYDEQYLNNEVVRILDGLRGETRNILLIGMPGCGKSTVGKLLAQKLGRSFYDADDELVKSVGKSIPDIFANEGEAGFRSYETEILQRLTKESGCVISAGGGAVTVNANLDLMRQNSVILWLKRELELLPTDGRPLSQANKLSAMYEKRRPLYEAASDCIISNEDTVEQCVNDIIHALHLPGGEARPLQDL